MAILRLVCVTTTLKIKNENFPDQKDFTNDKDVLCSRLRGSDSNSLNELICKVRYVVGVKLDHLETVMERRMLQKLLDNSTHPLHLLLHQYRSTRTDGLRLRQELNATEDLSLLQLFYINLQTS